MYGLYFQHIRFAGRDTIPSLQDHESSKYYKLIEIRDLNFQYT